MNMRQEKVKPSMVADTILALGWQRQEDCHKSEASLVFSMSSRSARAPW